MAWSDWMSTKHVLAKQREAQEKQFIDEYDGIIEVHVSDRSFEGACNKCGRTATCNWSELPGQIYLCERCTDKKVEQRGHDIVEVLPWHAWKRKFKP